MAMIVQHNLTAMNANRQLGISTGALAKSTEKLSSGYRINRAADDAAGLAISEKMRSQIRGLDQASTNASDGISMIQTAEGALNESHSILQRMRELAVQAANGTETDSDRGNIQDEIEQLQEELDRIASDTEFNTMKLLDGSLSAASAGSASAGPKFGVYDDQLRGFITSDVSGVAVTVSNAATVGGESAIWDSTGKTVTLNLAKGMTYSQSEIDELLRNAKQEDSTASATPAKATISLKYGSLTVPTIGEGYTTAVTETGARATTKGDLIHRSETLTLSSAFNAGNVEPNEVQLTVKSDVKEPPYVVQFEIDDTITAATAVVANTAAQVPTTPPTGVTPTTGTLITITLPSSGFDGEQTYSANEINGFIKAALEDAQIFDKIEISLNQDITIKEGAKAGLTDNESGLSNAITGRVITDNATEYVGANQIDFTANKYGRDTNIIIDLDFTASPGKEECAIAENAVYDDDGKLVTPAKYTLSLSSGIEYTEEDIEALLAVEGLSIDVTLSGPNPDEPNTLFITNSALTCSSLLDGGRGLGDEDAYLGEVTYGTQAGGKGVILQVGANEGQTLSFSIDDMSATALGVNASNVNVSTQVKATECIKKIDDAIQMVSKQRSLLGAVQNRLEHTISNLDNTAENLQAAESGIRDADMASEMVTMSKYNILQQAGQSMLAQANQATQGVLSLLQG